MKTRVAARWNAGATMQEIGNELGISRQRVHQILDQVQPHKGRRKYHRAKKLNTEADRHG